MRILSHSVKDSRLPFWCGQINQQKESVSINSNDISISHATQLNYAIPALKTAGLSQGARHAR